MAATAVIASLAVGTLPASAVPTTGPDDPQPNSCLDDTDTSITPSVETAVQGTSFTVSWKVTSPCNPIVTVTGIGFGTGRIAKTGSVVVNAPLKLGSTSWFMRMSWAGQNRSAASASVYVTAASRPPLAVAENTDGRMELFRTNSSGAISHRSQSSVGSKEMSPWYGFEGSLASVAAVNRSARLEVWGINADGLVYSRNQVSSGTGAWTDWVQPGTNPTVPERMVSLGVTPNNTVMLSDKTNIWLYRGPPNFSEQWIQLPASTHRMVTIAAADNADGRTEIFGLSGDNTIWHRWQTSKGGGTWSDWVQFGGALSSIAAARYPDGRMELYGANPDGQIFHKLQRTVNSTTDWAEWASFEGGMSSVAADVNGNGQVEIYGVNSIGQYWRKLQTARNGPDWNQWEILDEATPTVRVAAPLFGALVGSAANVSISWHDASTNETSFLLQYRNYRGVWTNLTAVPTQNSPGTFTGSYSYVDTRDLSGQCYRVIAVNHDDAAATAENCTVRPDPGRYPQSVLSSASQWSGFTNTNGGGARISNKNSGGVLIYQDRTFPVSLGWGTGTEAWTVYAEGGPTLMKGQALALKLGDKGWLKYSVRQFGVDVELSDEPEYEWYVIGDGASSPRNGAPLTEPGNSALWNSSADGYLVTGSETWGIDLDFVNATGGPIVTNPPPPPTNPPVPSQTQHIKGVYSFNCSTDRREVDVWMKDLTTGGAFQNTGTVNSQYDGSGGCPAVNSVPATFTPTAGHTYQVRITDKFAAACGSHLPDPNEGGCIVAGANTFTFTGDPNGVNMLFSANLPVEFR